MTSTLVGQVKNEHPISLACDYNETGFLIFFNARKREAHEREIRDLYDEMERKIKLECETALSKVSLL